jgi:RHS repeat-associated protein
MTKETRAPGETIEAKTEYVYDGAGRLVRTKGESGVKGVTSPTDPAYYRYDVVEQRTYDTSGRVSQIRVPTPDAWYCVWSTSTGCVADANCTGSCVGWVVTQNTYTGTGALKSVSEDWGGIGAATNYTYDDHGWTLSETSPEGRATSYTYDAAGNITRVTRPNQSSGTVAQARTFTPTGLLGTETDFATNPAAAGTPTRSFVYSSNGWLTRATDALGTKVDYSYDDRGNRIERRSTQTVGGAPGATCPTPSPTCVKETWAYDAAGQLASHTFPRDNTTDTTVTYGYDGAGRLKTTQEPVSGGQMRCETNTFGAHRLTQVDYWYHPSSCAGAPASPETVSFGYDALDQRTRVTDKRGGTQAKNTTYSFDTAGRVYNRTDAHTGENEGWRWSAVGIPVRLNQNDVFLPWMFSHDDLGRLDVTTLNFYGVLVPMVDHTYDKDGLLTHELLNNSGAKYRDYTYFASGQLKTYKQDLAQVDLVESQLTWRPDGRIGTECTDATLNGTCSGSTETSIYDQAGQVRGQGAGCAFSGGTPNASCTYAYSYDGHGNRTSAKRPGATMTYTNNRADQLTQQIAGSTTSTYTYDWAGRLDVTTVNGGSGGTSDNSYGPMGRLTGAVSQTPGWPTSTSTLRYDGDGGLMTWEVNNDADPDSDSTSQFVWDDTMGVPKVIESVTDNDGTGPNAPVENYANYGAKRVADSSGWFGYDWQDSIVRTTGIPALPTGYGPFGEVENLASFVWFGYRGEYTVGFEYLHLRNRDYNPLTGRFPTPDALDGVDGTPTTANKYHYTDNDPLNKTDPLGLRPEDGDGTWNPIAVPTYKYFDVPQLRGWGKVRMGMFIMQDVYGVWPNTGAGDGRGFDPGMTAADNRAYIEVNYETGRGYIFVKPSCETSSYEDADTCVGHGPTLSDSQFSSRIRGNSVLEMKWDLENSRRGIGIAGNDLAITGNVKLIPLDGKICLSGGHDRFPSYEIYHDVGGDTRTLYQREQAQILGATGLFDPIPDARFPACEVGGLNPPTPQQPA